MNRPRFLLLALFVAALAFAPMLLGNFGVSLLNDIGISALVALGRRTAALSRGARFQRDFPTSPYRDQVQQLLR